MFYSLSLKINKVRRLKVRCLRWIRCLCLWVSGSTHICGSACPPLLRRRESWMHSLSPSQVVVHRRIYATCGYLVGVVLCELLYVPPLSHLLVYGQYLLWVGHRRNLSQIVCPSGHLFVRRWFCPEREAGGFKVVDPPLFIQLIPK